MTHSLGTTPNKCPLESDFFCSLGSLLLPKQNDWNPNLSRMNISARNCVFVVEIIHSLWGKAGRWWWWWWRLHLFVSDLSLPGCWMWSGLICPVQICHLISSFLWERTGPQWREGRLEPHLLSPDWPPEHTLHCIKTSRRHCLCLQYFLCRYLSAKEVTTIIPAVANQSLVF